MSDPTELRVEFGDARLPPKFWDKAKPDGAGCWLWTAGINPGGYGHLSFEGKTQIAHRVAYKALVGPIPEGKVCDHLCRVRRCVNPAHIEPVTSLENIRRGDAHLSSSRKSTRITHCPRGHPYTESNTRIDHRGCRNCRECHRIRWHERKGFWDSYNAKS